MLPLILFALTLSCFGSLCVAFAWRRLCSSVGHLDGPKSVSFWRGNLGQLYSRTGWQFHRDIVEKYGGAVKIHGLLGCHQVYVSDPKALHHILVKDVNVYEETTWYIEGNLLVFGPGLLSTLSDHHRRQRKLLNPVFSIKHIRNLTPIFFAISQKLKDAVAYETRGGPKEVDMLEWMSRAALEIIGQGGLGCSIDSLRPDVNSSTPYGNSIKNLIPTAFKLSMFRLFIPFFVRLGPPMFRRFLLDYTPSALLQKMKGIVDVMDKTSKDIFVRKKADALSGNVDIGQGSENRDIMSILLKANLSASAVDRLPDNELLAQMSTFMFAAHDTTSSALSRTLHCLAEHQNVQIRLRQEIKDSGVLDSEISYDALMALPFLDAVCRETLRLHPPINFMARTARKDMVLPLGSPVVSADGVTEIREIPVKKGTDIIVGFGAVNKITSIWGSDAYEWKPERWLSPLPKTLAERPIPGVYSSLLTFSGGARSCIGFKFAELEMKMVLATLITAFRFEPPETTEVIWNLGGIQTPASKGAETAPPHLILKVSQDWTQKPN